MTTPLRFLRTEVIDKVTEGRIREYEAKVGVQVSLPVPVEQIIEQVLNLDFDWDEIEEMPGEQILGGLDAENRKILINEKHRNLFEEKPGLLRSTIGHEAGHWDLDIDRGRLLHPQFPGLDFQQQVVKRHTKLGNLAVILKHVMQDDRAYTTFKTLTTGQDAPEVASAVDRYQSSLLMPSWLMKEAAQRYDLIQWSALYDLAKEAQVNISNLTVRLHRLELIFIPKGSKKIYKSKGEYAGQGSLFE